MAQDGKVNELIANRRLQFRFMRHDGWENALFVHWPIDPLVLKEKLPGGLEVDIRDGMGWIGLVLLTERGVSVTPAAGRRLAPKIDHLGANIRTYVRYKGIPGIYFFSLECSSTFASIGARVAGIPYFPADMHRTVDIEYPLLSTKQLAENFAETGNDEVRQKDPSSDADFVFEFSSQRSKGGPAVSARWRLSEEKNGATEMLDSDLARARWFVERYSVYAAWPWGRGPLLLRGDVEHPTWSLQSAVLDELNADTLFEAAGFSKSELPLTCSKNSESGLETPHVCFSRGVGPVDFWMLEPP